MAKGVRGHFLDLQRPSYLQSLTNKANIFGRTTLGAVQTESEAATAPSSTTHVKPNSEPTWQPRKRKASVSQT
ncbi:hypothetical protein BGZ90_006272, partial [Linnemannia elongata]